MSKSVTFDVTPEKEAAFSSFLYRQLFVTPPVVSDVDLKGKTAIVTGSNIGLGLECSRQLLQLGLSKLILAVRDEAKGNAAMGQLLSSSETKPDIQVWKLDLSSYESITAFAKRTNSLERLDIVVLNAGVLKPVHELNPHTGHEEVMQVNYLSTVLLAVLLLPVLREKNTPQHPGRLVFVSSETAAWSVFKERDSRPMLAAFDNPDSVDMQDRYCTSKLLGQLFMFALTKRVHSSVAVVNACNPGLCHGSALHHETNGSVKGYVLGGVKRLIGRSTSVGARVLTDAAVMHGDESHGQYISDSKLKPLAPIIYSSEGEKLAEVLWEETMEELAFAGVADIIKSLSS